jgi:hypothetical protein
MMAFPTTDKAALDTARRRAFVLELRKRGKSYRVIAEAAKQQFGDELPRGWDERYAYKDVRRELDRLKEDTAEDALAVKQIELERLDMVVSALADQVKRGHLGAIDRWIRASESRRKLLGVDAPQRQEHTGASGGAVTIRIEGVIDDAGDG